MLASIFITAALNYSNPEHSNAASTKICDTLSQIHQMPPNNAALQRASAETCTDGVQFCSSSLSNLKDLRLLNLPPSVSSSRKIVLSFDQITLCCTDPTEL